MIFFAKLCQSRTKFQNTTVSEQINNMYSATFYNVKASRLLSAYFVLKSSKSVLIFCQKTTSNIPLTHSEKNVGIGLFYFYVSSNKTEFLH